MCRRIGVIEATIYKWKKKYAGMGVTELKKLKFFRRRKQAVKRNRFRFELRQADFTGGIVKKILRSVAKRDIVACLEKAYQVTKR